MLNIDFFSTNMYPVKLKEYCPVLEDYIKQIKEEGIYEYSELQQGSSSSIIFHVTRKDEFVMNRIVDFLCLHCASVKWARQLFLNQ